MNRQFTRRRRDKGTQVTKRPAHTQSTKYRQKRIGLLRLVINSDLNQGTFLTKQNLLKIIYDRRSKHQKQIPPFIYQCLKKVQQLQPTQSNMDIQYSISNAYATLLASSNIFYQMQKNTWIMSQSISPKSLRFTFNKQKQIQRQFRPPQMFTLKQFPCKIQDYQIFKGSPPIAVINFGLRLVGLTVSMIKQQQKQLFNYELSSKVQKYLVQKDSLFALLKNGSIVFGKIGDQLDFLDDSKAKFSQLKLCGSDVLVVTKDYVIINNLYKSFISYTKRLIN